MENIIGLDEIPTPDFAQGCRKCSVATAKNRVIWGEGNTDAPLVIILDNPGAREDALGVPFVCGTRKTLLSALYDAGISRDKVFLTFLLKCRPTKKYNKQICRNTCLSYLKNQVQGPRSRVLLGMGNIVAQALLSDTAEVKNLRDKQLTLWGLPFFLSYHPLAARRRPVLYDYIVKDLKKVSLNLMN